MLQETNINSAIIVFMMYSKGIQLLSFIIQEIQRVEFLGIWNIKCWVNSTLMRLTSVYFKGSYWQREWFVTNAKKNKCPGIYF